MRHNEGVLCAGILLTGGASRRLGVDKATLVVDVRGGPSSATLAVRTASALGAVTEVAVEVGPGTSGLAFSMEDPPRGGPLAALAEGCRLLRGFGWEGPVVVVATDLPYLQVRFLRWLVEYPGDCSVVPLLGGVPQPLCARYGAGVFDAALELLRRGDRSMRALLEMTHPSLVDPEIAGAPKGWQDSLADVDTPEELASLRRGASERTPMLRRFPRPLLEGLLPEPKPTGAP